MNLRIIFYENSIEFHREVNTRYSNETLRENIV